MRANKVAVIVAGGMLACGAMQAVQAAAQSLGDVAKKEEERRKQVTAAGKVYTNKDLAPAPPSSMPPPAPDASGAAAGSGATAKEPAADGKSADKDASKDAGDKKDQAYWSGRMKAAQEAVDRDSTLADAMQSRINALATDFVNRDDPAQRAVIERDRQKALGELERLRKQITADKKAITDIEEEARRAGVPPGWLR